MIKLETISTDDYTDQLMPNTSNTITLKLILAKALDDMELKFKTQS